MPKAKSKINKSQWIRQQDSSLTAKEVVEKAKRKDIEITPQQVYTVRHIMAKQDGSKAKPAAKAVAAKAVAAKTVVKRGPRKVTTVAVEAAAPALKAKPATQLNTMKQQFIAIAIQLGAIESTRLLSDWQQGQQA